MTVIGNEIFASVINDLEMLNKERGGNGKIYKFVINTPNPARVRNNFAFKLEDDEEDPSIKWIINGGIDSIIKKMIAGHDDVKDLFLYKRHYQPDAKERGIIFSYELKELESQEFSSIKKEKKEKKDSGEEINAEDIAEIIGQAFKKNKKKDEPEFLFFDVYANNMLLHTFNYKDYLTHEATGSTSFENFVIRKAHFPDEGYKAVVDKLDTNARTIKKREQGENLTAFEKRRKSKRFENRTRAGYLKVKYVPIKNIRSKKRLAKAAKAVRQSAEQSEAKLGSLRPIPEHKAMELIKDGKVKMIVIIDNNKEYLNKELTKIFHSTPSEKINLHITYGYHAFEKYTEEQIKNKIDNALKALSQIRHKSFRVNKTNMYVMRGRKGRGHVDLKMW